MWRYFPYIIVYISCAWDSFWEWTKKKYNSRVLTPNTKAGTGVNFFTFIIAKNSGKCFWRAPTKHSLLEREKVMNKFLSLNDVYLLSAFETLLKRNVLYNEVLFENYSLAIVICLSFQTRLACSSWLLCSTISVVVLRKPQNLELNHLFKFQKVR